MTKRSLILLGALAYALPLGAQEHGQHQEMAGEHDGPPPYVSALAMDLEQVEGKVLALAEAIPEEDWSWRPGEGVRSVSEVFRHIAADNYYMPTLVGIAAPAETGVTGEYESAVAYENRAMTKAETMAALRASFGHLRAALDGVGHDDLHAEHSFFGNQMSAIQIWLITATHLHEHLGQSIAYARSNGVVPPWSVAAR